MCGFEVKDGAQKAAMRRDRQPEIELADLMQTQLNVYVRPDEVGHFIKTHWPRVAALAHRIHGSTA